LIPDLPAIWCTYSYQRDAIELSAMCEIPKGCRALTAEIENYEIFVPNNLYLMPQGFMVFLLALSHRKLHLIAFILFSMSSI
jgi:hypothetical protein